MGVIRKQKAEFLLNSIRQGGIHDLMKKEMLKLLLEDGYDSSDLEYYLTNNEWPPSRHREDSAKEFVDQFMNDGGRRTKRMKRAVINITVAVLLLFGILFGLSIIDGNDDESKTRLSPSPIEETTDGKKAL